MGTATEDEHAAVSAGIKPTASHIDGDELALAEAIRREHALTFRQAIALYPQAMAWSAFVSIGVIMLAFDPQLLGNLFATPQFQKDFGYEFEGEVSRGWLLLNHCDD